MNFKKIVSLVLAVMMIMSTFVITTAPVSADKEIDRVILDFRSEAALEASGGGFYIHKPTAGEPDPLTGGKFSFSTEKQAMRIEYAESKVQPVFRIMTITKKSGVIPSDYKYMVVVYQAKTTQDYNLYLFNSVSQGEKITFKAGGKDTAGKWVISDAFDISKADGNGKSIMSRWQNPGVNNRLWFESNDKSAEFYIKEYGFFKSPEDAKAYYASADLSKAPTSTVAPAPEAPAAPAPSTPAAPAPAGTYNVATVPTIEDTGEVSQQSGSASTPAVANVEPYIMDLSSWGNMAKTKATWYKHDGKEEGQRKMVVNSGDDNSTQFLYSPGSSWAAYRGMLKFTEKNVVTMDHKWGRITYKVIDDTAGQIVITNNGGAGSMNVVQNTLASNGEWVVSAPFDMTKCQFIDRFVNGMHVTIQYNGSNPNAQVYIKNFMLFGSEQQAYEYVGDSPADNVNVASYSALTFGNGGSAGFLTGPKYGVYSVDDGLKAVVITHSPDIGSKTGYMSKIKFNSVADYDVNNVFTRVLYSAKNPEGVEKTNFYLFHDANGQTVQLAKDVVNTNGEFVLSDTFCLAPTMPSRYKSGLHCSFMVNTGTPGGEYAIRAIYFFRSREAADNFSISGGSTKLTINGNDISKYQIVTSDADVIANTAATKLQTCIFDLTGVNVKIVDDNSPVSEYEILIGKSERELSDKKFDALQAAEFKPDRAITTFEGNTLVFAAQIPKALNKLIENFNLSHLYEGVANLPENIAIDSKVELDTVVNPFTVKDWGSDPNVSDPQVFTSDFSFDEGYFAEENAEDNFEYVNGVYKTKDNAKNALSYIHVYEPDVKFSLDVKYTGTASGDMGIMTRYNSADAWVKAGYDFKAGEWYIDNCEGKDFYAIRIASVKAAINPDTYARLTLEVDETAAKFYVDGVLMLESSSASHTSPGRVGFYANGVQMTVDNAELVLTSGQGTIWKDVAHTKLPVDSYIEGGSVYEMSDGSLVYQHHSTNTFRSLDNGKTWQKADQVFPVSGYMNVLKLNDGSFMQIFSEGGYWVSKISKDDGKTWETTGKVCATKYQDTAAGAGNMNDKLMQTASGKLFYGQNYEISNGGSVDGRKVFCEFYYSEDLGKTWIKSETDSWEIEGNEKSTYFGEAKMLECADGTIRMYDSWNTHKCLVYSESKDGGKTFGPLVKMEDFPSSRSSMQFVRDKWGETNTTYYMIWINNASTGDAMPRSRLSLAKSTDGKNWTRLGDVWRWESNYRASGDINHIVDPFVNTTKDYILIGSGFSEHSAFPGEPSVSSYHNAQRQHIYSIPKASIVPGEPLGAFTDVDTSDSYYDAVKYAVDNGLFNGTSETTFAPDTIMNRAMFVTVLGRMAKADTAAFSAPTFADVLADQWYTSYVGWANANGIVKGMTETEFGVNGNITVEQACTILFRYADGKTAAAASGKTVTDFTDGDLVSAWAVDGVKWAIENGIYTGVGEALSPSCAAPRWLVATMFANYASLIG